jgi:hypothetical protein
VRAPRPLLQIKQENGLETSISDDDHPPRAIHSLLLTIENAYSNLLDVEDTEMLLRHNESSAHFNIAQLKLKREELANDLFKSLHVHPPFPPAPLQSRFDKSEEPTFLQ